MLVVQKSMSDDKLYIQPLFSFYHIFNCRSTFRERNSAYNATEIAKELQKKSEAIAERVRKIDFSDLLKAFKNLKQESSETKENADKGAEILDLAKKIDYKV